MNPIQFTTVVGPDGVIHPPVGVELPLGAMEVSIRPAANADLETRLQALWARRGFGPDSLTDDIRKILLEDLDCEDRGVPPPRPGPGACKGMILYMAPDFDAPLEDMKEYME